ncbi:TrbI/VirB10 family protein [Nodosilinea sp. P-1105]|uniref:TrbI/VirB10 family protein n=1 Tax=Nodosilinea sp. P-1105 TaxID=2546229 RepID=UPI00146B1244|nr:TrbI/VirB10 family protein [Nodosilinea sp. P-1105]NMF84164.1 hypothetical protein [Nodosilinea sp. P-1105]
MSSLPDPNLEMLREMTGAPDLSEPLVTAAAFNPEPVKSERPFWKLPVPKLVLIGAALVPVFALAGVFIIGSRQRDIPETTTPPPEADPTAAQPQTVDAELEEARAEIAALKAQMALDDQGLVPTTTAGTPPRPTMTPTTSPAAAVTPSPRPTPSAPPPTVSARPASPTVSYPAPTPRLQPTVTPPPVASRPSAVSAAPTSAATPAADPVERWQQLAQVGSYGRMPLPEAATESVTSPEPVAQAQFARVSSHPAPAPVSSPESMATNGAPDISEAEPPDLPEIDAVDQGPVAAADSETVTYPDILTADEARILQPSTPPASLVAGTQSSGSLTTPVILDNTAEGNKLLVVLSEPLVDSQGQVAIPAGGELVVRVETVSDNGLVQLSATQAIWTDQGQARELMLPQGVIQIRGQGGMPLQAEAYDDIGPEIAAMDAGQFALGSIRRASELYTRPNTRVETGSSTTVVTTENPAPNVWAGILEGGTDAILDTIAERNQRAIEALEQRPRLAYIEAGRPVQVFVNQSMQMPI